MAKLRIISHSDEAFDDRMHAGRLLGEALSDFKGKFALVLGIPRGGVIIANELAKVIDAELDIVLSAKLGAPQNPELAIGAVSEGGGFFLNEVIASAVGVDSVYIRRQKELKLSEISRRLALFRKIRLKVPLVGRLVIVTDDGVATGSTMEVTLLALGAEKPKRLIAALPVASADSLARLKDLADEIVVLKVPEALGAVGQFYRNFEQASDNEVFRILELENKKGL